MPVKEANLNKVLQDYKSAIDLELSRQMKSTSLNNFARSKSLESIQYSVSNGGKRLRPILALLVAEAITQKNYEVAENPALPLALAIELVHCGSLIHDDLPSMDNDDLRRGKPTNHKVYGDAVALLAGDTLLCYPVQVLLEAKIEPEIINDFVQAIEDMIAGQAMDLELPQSENKTIDDLKLMQSLKTGALLQAAVVLAARIVNANQQQVEALTNYAHNIGLAFQITDDILDQTASSEELGKTAGKDLEQNKFTFVTYYGLDKAAIIAKELVAEAKAALAVIPNSEHLGAIADYVISREH
ncbi:MAG: polyprenyl synthetase family protein [Candidatus Melainabacteria bacterium]|nr:polyprenyl synthetase family protein [Candidatus Melainabacteria bacterium]